MAYTPNPYGCMFMNTVNAPLVLTIPATDTFYPLTSGLSNGGTSGITFQNASELRIDTPGTYLVNWAMAVDSKANQFIEVTVMQNGVSQAALIGAVQVFAAQNAYATSGNGVLILAKGDSHQARGDESFRRKQSRSLVGNDDHS